VNCEFFQPLIAALRYTSDEGLKTRVVLDFVNDYDASFAWLSHILHREGTVIAAHNAGFEQAVLDKMGIDLPSSSFVDTAVLARAAGAAGKLEAAAPQLLGVDKLESGLALIKLFSIPGLYQVKDMKGEFDPQIIPDHQDDWDEFVRYCQVDADLSYELAVRLLPTISDKELANTAVTMDMNNVGWFVDMPLVREMQRRYDENVEQIVEAFRLTCNAPDLNLASFPQLQAWCAERGVKASSFDEASVQKMLNSLRKRMSSTPAMPEAQALGYAEVIELLITKQTMGGSSLKKLQTLEDRVGPDDRLRDSYLHIGAGATYRTSGRGVQMQNLKRLNGQGDDVELLYDPEIVWDNDTLASNLRQVFRAAHDDGKLIVGDFSSVESRGLAWQAGEQWKLDAYHAGQDLYKVQASKIFGVAYDQVTKDQRQIGKVGELACGYGAGPDAVHDFAAKMGVEMTQLEAASLVKDWRAANEGIVAYWHALDAALHEAVSGKASVVDLPHGTVTITPTSAPESLQVQTNHEVTTSLRIAMRLNDSTLLFTRVIHGAHLKGRNIGYWKPSERKTGDLWVDRFTNPKTKQVQAYSMYGGKLSGILTQSLCRELFFDSLRAVHAWVGKYPNVKLVGQFHDEIVVEWFPQPGKPNLPQTMEVMRMYMTETHLPGFPLDAEIKSDFRYTK
jgi:DNA polymerase I-like protein with 3'-5' exonuclease and polymerase domains